MSEEFKNALGFLINKLIYHNKNAENNKTSYLATNFNYVHAYSDLIRLFLDNIDKKIKDVESINKLINYTQFSFQNISYNISWHINNINYKYNNYSEKNLLSQKQIEIINKINEYPQSIIDVIKEYSIILLDEYILDYNSNNDIINIYLSKLLIEVLYNLHTNEKQYEYEIENLNKLTKTYDIIYYPKGDNYVYYKSLIDKILKSNLDKQPIIMFFEDLYKKFKDKDENNVDNEAIILDSSSDIDLR